MKMSGPIPGENFTSDTKNYPWHRPPEFTDTDKAIDMIAKRLLAPESSHGILAMLETGMDVATITDIFLTSGIGAGKWTVDFAILLAGPTAHIITLMAEARDIDYDLGIEDSTPKLTSVYYKRLMKEKSDVSKIREEIDLMDVKEQAAEQSQGGFMNMPAPEQEAAPIGNPEEEGII